MTKRNWITRGLLVMLTAALVLAMALPAFATEATEPSRDMEIYIDTVRNEDVSNMQPMSGTCGENVRWELKGTAMTISGKGDMANYTGEDLAPWYAQRNRIETLVVESGVTSIGKLAFYQCEKLQTVRIADTVTAIGDIAFAQCWAMASIMLGSGITRIGYSAFEDCVSLTAVRLPETLTTLGQRAFYHCAGLGGIILPAALVNVGGGAFAYCTNLSVAEIRGTLTALPYWTFYGCTNLNTLYLPSTVENIEQSALSACPVLSNVNYDGSPEVWAQIDQAFRESEDVYSDVDVSTDYNQTDHADITVTDKTYSRPDANGNPRPGSTNISATLTGKDGWTDVVDTITGKQDGMYVPDTDVYVPDATLDKDTLTDLAGQTGNVTIHTPGNVDWQIRLEDQQEEQLSGKQDLNVTVTKNDTVPGKWEELVGDSDSFTVVMGGNTLNTTVSIPVGGQNVYQTATLYNKKQEVVQTTIVDERGKAAFHLAGVDKGEYMIVINDKTVDPAQTVIPERLYDQFGLDDSGATLMDSQGNRYVITRNTSALPFTLTQLIVGVVIFMIAIAVVVGVVMVMMNRQRLLMSRQGIELPEPGLPVRRKKKKTRK